MAVPNNMDSLEWLRKHLEEDGGDLLREMVKSFAEQLMAAEVDAMCGASYGERTPERVTKRNGDRGRDFDTRAGTPPSGAVMMPRAAGGARYQPLAPPGLFPYNTCEEDK